jgi:hypothetical protein
MTQTQTHTPVLTIKCLIDKHDVVVLLDDRLKALSQTIYNLVTSTTHNSDITVNIQTSSEYVTPIFITYIQIVNHTPVTDTEWLSSLKPSDFIDVFAVAIRFKMSEVCDLLHKHAFLLYPITDEQLPFVTKPQISLFLSELDRVDDD